MKIKIKIRTRGNFERFIDLITHYIVIIFKKCDGFDILTLEFLFFAIFVYYIWKPYTESNKKHNSTGINQAKMFDNEYI